MRRILAGLLGFAIMWGVLGTQRALSMGGQFGTYTQAYLDRQKCKADGTCVKPLPRSHRKR